MNQVGEVSKQYKENKNRIAEVNNKLSDTASRDDEIQILKNKLDDIEKNITEILKTIGQLENRIYHVQREV